MKTHQEQGIESKQVNFYRQRINKSPSNNKSNSNTFTNDYKNGAIISKLQINFPKMKICQSKRDLTQQSEQYQDQDNKQYSSTNKIYTSNQYDQNNNNKLYQEFNIGKKQRSPTRFNQYSYQQTTKQDYSQNNTSSYHDFFKVPIQLNSGQIGTSPFGSGGNYKQFDTKKQFDIKKQFDTKKEINSKKQINSKSIQPFSIQTKYDNQEYKYQDKTQMKYNYQPTIKNQSKYQSNSIKSLQSPKQKGQMSLSQLLSDLQRRSQKLYQIYGQNNQDYQKCLETIEKHQKSSLVKPSQIKQNQSYQKQQNIYNNIDFNFSKNNVNKQDQPYYKPYEQRKNYLQPSQRNQEITHSWKNQPYQNKSYQQKNYTPIKQKTSLNFDKPYDSADKKYQPIIAESTPLLIDGLINKTKDNNKIDKKKKVMFYHQEQQNQKNQYQNLIKNQSTGNQYTSPQNTLNKYKYKSALQQKTYGFVNHVTKFFNLYLLDILRSKFYYQTGVLSTESNIHAPSNKNTSDRQINDKIKDDKETSFFQQYFQQKRKTSQDDITYGGTGSIQYDKTVNMKRSTQRDHLTPYDLLPIQQQLQSSYGQSMTKSQQKKESPIMHKQEYRTINQKKRSQVQYESKFKEYINTNQSRGVQELLIESINKEIFKFNPNQKQIKKTFDKQRKKQINLKVYGNGLLKVSDIMKYKVLTLLRYTFLMLKFLNPNHNQKLGISSLKASSVSRQSKQTTSKNVEYNNYVDNQKQSIGFEKIQKTDMMSKVAKNQGYQIFNDSNAQRNRISSINPNQINHPNNILEHYYKKSSPNSLTNQYASIIEEPKPLSPRVQINQYSSNERNYAQSKSIIRTNQIKQNKFNPALTKEYPQNQNLLKPQMVNSQPIPNTIHQTNGNQYTGQYDYYINQNNQKPYQIKNSQFIQPANLQPQALQQDYYVIGTHQQSQSKLSRPRTSRALSSSSSKVTINHLPILNPPRISKQSLLNMRQSQLPLASPTNTGSNFYNYGIQNSQQYTERRQSSSMRQSQIMQKPSTYESKIHNDQIIVSPSNISATKNSQFFSNTGNNFLPTTSNRYAIQQSIPKPVEPQRNQIDYYNSKGKISRSYSQNDFKNYYQRTNTILNQNRPINTVQNPPQFTNLPPQIMRSSNIQSRERVNTITQSSNQKDLLRRNSTQQFPPNVNLINPSMRNSHMNASNIPYSQLQQIQTSSNQYALQSSSSNNSKLLQSNINQNFPVNQYRQQIPSTVRPLLNPSLQKKKRSYSMGSFLNGPSLIHNLNVLSTNNSMLKDLQSKPYIQFKHYIPNDGKNQNVFLSQNYNQPLNQNIQRQSNQGNQTLSNSINAQQQINRQRISKSMDQCMIRPSTFNGYIPTLPINSQQLPNNTATLRTSNIPPMNIYQQKAVYSSSQVHNNQFPNRYQPNNLNSKYISNPSNNTQKQIQVDSQYHMLKNTYQLKSGVNSKQNLGMKNLSATGNSFNRSNQLMKGTAQNFGKGSRVRYEQQNLVPNSVNNYNLSDPRQIYKSPPPQQKQTLNKITQPNMPLANPLLTGSQQQRVQSPSQKMGVNKIPMAKSGMSSGYENQKGSGSQVLKSKSPQVLLKGKSGQNMRGSRQLGSKSKYIRLGNYGQD